jgi:cation transport regulator
MTYKKVSELPDRVRDNLPKHAQEIYKEAFNSAFEQYDNNEERAHRVAWGAVKKSYKKDKKSGKWIRKSSAG